ncbi:MAG: putative nucleotide-binding protein (sugar kinase/HSP70/actin superfamily) [Myxococcota bacterium]|jgi:predicted nucleotide-binding protein (sugar kinase/HSP70/actin superfamily)
MTSFVSMDSLGINRGPVNADLDFDIDAELAKFEAEERTRLGMADDEVKQWVEPLNNDPTTASKSKTTILVSGLTLAQDHFIVGALNGLGYKVTNLDCPDTDALRYGKEFGNRGQCNPTYFTVGNLVKSLTEMRDAGMSTEQIVEDYVFMTAGSCGPCRFGMYVTEYRKALRDAGFDGFRVLLFQMNGGIKQASGDENSDGLVFDPKFFLSVAKALLSGDALNAIMYRMKPYEVVKGSVDTAIEECKGFVYEALYNNKNLLVALYKCRRVLAKVKLDRSAVKPKVAIIGEFWAMTTEGAGNYHMQRFLQEEGAEVDIQIVTQWICFMVWEGIRDTRHRMTLRQDDTAKKGLEGKDGFKRIWMLRGANVALRGLFYSLSNTLGLHGYWLADMQKMADISADFYNNDLRGGEAHLEVGKVISNVVNQKVNMTLSVKPFGCMPSSGVSDGVQSAITELYPEAIFLPIETTGDGAVNVYSRVQMMLFKARQAAEREVKNTLEAYEMSMEEVQAFAKRIPFVNHALFKAPHRHGSTAADLVELVGGIRHPVKGLKRWLGHRKHKPVYRQAKSKQAIANPAQAAAAAAGAGPDLEGDASRSPPVAKPQGPPLEGRAAFGHCFCLWRRCVSIVPCQRAVATCSLRALAAFFVASLDLSRPGAF